MYFRVIALYIIVYFGYVYDTVRHCYMLFIRKDLLWVLSNHYSLTRLHKKWNFGPSFDHSEPLPTIFFGSFKEKQNLRWWYTERRCWPILLIDCCLGIFPLKMGNTFLSGSFRSVMGPVSHLVAHWWQHFSKSCPVYHYQGRNFGHTMGENVFDLNPISWMYIFRDYGDTKTRK